MKQLSIFQKKSILILSSQKLSLRAIAQKVGCSHTTVNNCIAKFKGIKCLERKKCSARVRNKTACEDRFSKQCSLKNRLKTAVDIRTEFIEADGVEIGVHTVR